MSLPKLQRWHVLDTCSTQSVNAAQILRLITYEALERVSPPQMVCPPEAGADTALARKSTSDQAFSLFARGDRVCRMAPSPPVCVPNSPCTICTSAP